MGTPNVFFGLQSPWTLLKLELRGPI
jgi:hypothetical protein